MNVLAIIPARGGSKGIPLKNIANLAGNPLISYAIQAAKNAQTVTRVIVSTDSKKIGEVAEIFGAEVVERPAEISGDFDSSEAALLHTIDYLAEDEGYHADIIVFLQCTSPLTTSIDIDGAVNMFIREKADTALSVTPFHYYVWHEDENGEGQGVNHDKASRVMRQERQDQYLENGAVYVMDAKKFIEHEFRFFGKTVMYVMPEERCLEIDEPVDLVIAEKMIEYLNRPL